MNRRAFLQASAASALTLASFNPLRAGTRLGLAASGKPMKAAVLGTGWFGMVNCRRMLEVAPEIEVAAMCDVDQKQIDGAIKQVLEKGQKHEPKKFNDFRKCLADDKYDIVIVGSPDHWHAMLAIAAMEAGADVYCEKPISKDIAEGRAMLVAARKLNRVMQVGTQRRSTPHVKKAMEYIRAGNLGTVSRIETCCYYHMRSRTTAADCAPPEGFDFDFWSGPAPLVAYHPEIHPRSWRSYWEYGNGICGDMCVHWLDTARYILGLSQPVRVASTGGIFVEKQSRANIADTQSALYDYGNVQVTWDYRAWGRPDNEKYPWAATFVGDKGTMRLNLEGYDVDLFSGKPVHVEAERIESDTDTYPKLQNDPVALANRGHWKNFLECIQSREKPVADIEQGHQSTLACILANMSMKLGRELKWDAANGKIVGDEQAQAMLQGKYREPWQHPALKYS
jgi:predicted dehydrogenase